MRSGISACRNGSVISCEDVKSPRTGAWEPEHHHTARIEPKAHIRMPEVASEQVEQDRRRVSKDERLTVVGPANHVRVLGVREQMRELCKKEKTLFQLQ